LKTLLSKVRFSSFMSWFDPSRQSKNASPTATHSFNAFQSPSDVTRVASERLNWSRRRSTPCNCGARANPIPPPIEVASRGATVLLKVAAAGANFADKVGALPRPIPPPIEVARRGATVELNVADGGANFAERDGARAIPTPEPSEVARRGATVLLKVADGGANFADKLGALAMPTPEPTEVARRGATVALKAADGGANFADKGVSLVTPMEVARRGATVALNVAEGGGSLDARGVTPMDVAKRGAPVMEAALKAALGAPCRAGRTAAADTAALGGAKWVPLAMY
jgi:hypothetical protein